MTGGSDRRPDPLEHRARTGDRHLDLRPIGPRAKQTTAGADPVLRKRDEPTSEHLARAKIGPASPPSVGDEMGDLIGRQHGPTASRSTMTSSDGTRTRSTTARCTIRAIRTSPLRRAISAFSAARTRTSPRSGRRSTAEWTTDDSPSEGNTAATYSMNARFGPTTRTPDRSSSSRWLYSSHAARWSAMAVLPEPGPPWMTSTLTLAGTTSRSSQGRRAGVSRARPSIPKLRPRANTPGSFRLGLAVAGSNRVSPGADACITVIFDRRSASSRVGRRRAPGSASAMP
jgi:hypothetical protein